MERGLSPADRGEGHRIGVVGAKDEHVHRFVDGDVVRRHEHGRRVCRRKKKQDTTLVEWVRLGTKIKRKRPETSEERHRTLDLEQVRRLDGLFGAVLGDRVGRLARQVALVVVAVQRENQTAARRERAVLLLQHTTKKRMKKLTNVKPSKTR